MKKRQSLHGILIFLGLSIDGWTIIFIKIEKIFITPLNDVNDKVLYAKSYILYLFGSVLFTYLTKRYMSSIYLMLLDDFYMMHI
uniref:Uncharacterized protein n=1 Tax=Salix viminalis TaxID=40686 RepID=A0A6N2LU19_SALVM